MKPCALDIVELVCGKNERKKVEAVPLSNDIIHSRIVEMSSNVLKQVIEELNASPFPFSMQLDEHRCITMQPALGVCPLCKT